MKPIDVKPVFVQTRNVRNFAAMMDGLALGAGEERLGLVYGQAGRGKSRTVQWHYANNGGVYLYFNSIWARSELAFLQALYREVLIADPPRNAVKCFDAIVDRLNRDIQPIFLDEIEKMPPRFLEIARDLTIRTLSPVILVGEEELAALMRRNRRVWSRTWQQLEFQPIRDADIIAYTQAATGISLPSPIAAIFHKASAGDFRLVKRDIINLVQIANAKGTVEITPQMATAATRMGLAGE